MTLKKKNSSGGFFQTCDFDRLIIVHEHQFIELADTETFLSITDSEETFWVEATQFTPSGNIKSLNMVDTEFTTHRNGLYQVMPTVSTLGNVSLQAFVNGNPLGDPTVLSAVCMSERVVDASGDFCICMPGQETPLVPPPPPPPTMVDVTGGGSSADSTQLESGSGIETSVITILTPASSSADTCNPCAAGYYKPDAAPKPCDACPVGTYQPATGTTTCISCPIGTFAAAEASTACESCPVSLVVNVAISCGGDPSPSCTWTARPSLSV